MDIKELLIGHTRRLAHVRRYSSYPVIRGENVAEHSFYVALYGLWVADDLRASGVEVDLNLVASKAIAHDLGESVTGDIVRSFKYSNEQLLSSVRDAETILVERETPPFLFQLWHKSKDASIEGRIVAFADILCVAAYLHEEWLLGNRHMRLVTREAKEYIMSFTEDPCFHKYRADLFVLLREITDGGF